MKAALFSPPIEGEFKLSRKQKKQSNHETQSFSNLAKVLGVATAAKAGCPISRLLKASITMDAKLET